MAHKSVRLYTYHEDGEGTLKVSFLTSIPTGHTKTVRALAWSPSGKNLATASFDANVGVWEQEEDEDGQPGEWECVGTLEGHETECKSVAYSSEGNLLASCSRDKTVWVWELVPESEFECMGVMMEHTQDVKCVSWHPREEILASASYDDTIKLYVDDPQDDWYCVNSLAAHESTVWSLAWSPNGNYLASASADKTVKIWRRTGQYDFDCVLVLEGNERVVYSVTWGIGKGKQEDGYLGWVASAGGDGVIRETSEGKPPSHRLLTRLPEAHGVHDINSVAWCSRSGYEDLLASAGDDGVTSVNNDIGGSRPWKEAVAPKKFLNFLVSFPHCRGPCPYSLPVVVTVPGLAIMQNQFDVLIVGAGVVGCSLAHALSTLKRKTPLRIALLERSMDEPDRIVGELLQPGGVMALKSLGLEHTLENIDAIPVDGYCVVDSPKSKSVQIPYPNGHQGRSFHHGKFIMNLRRAASKAKGVQVIEATVTDLLRDQASNSNRVIGVSAIRKERTEGAMPVGSSEMDNDKKESFFADLVVIADGCFSNFRTQVMGQRACKPVTKSYFVGVVLEDASLPYKHHGTVVLTKSAGPVLLYQIGTHDTRMLVDIQAPLPSDLKSHIAEKIIPQLPSSLHIPAMEAIKKDRLRRMPNSFLPPIQQGHHRSNADNDAPKSVFLLGDAWNMRHPLTGGGMTVAFNDVVVLRDLFEDVRDFKDWDGIQSVLHRWHWKRKPLSSTVNILSVALYDLFGADDDRLEVLRTGCFKYFELGGECVNGPVSLLSAIIQSPAILFYHFFSVAFYSIWVMFTHPRLVKRRPDEKPRLVTPGIVDYPGLMLKSLLVFWTAIIVFVPLMWTEIRWWSPDDARVTRNTLVGLAIPAGVILGLATTDFGRIGF
ncbi:hypothetical protein D9758_009649 [Tetrapyrgos nigripes]|uniref:Probable cytosolic iron-sulfur protein assembly protein 1 n=1 Tax=Tetrapyrgos nigripes TaxID=182062 RepID=A0A8H5FQ92_9AGAR|nr:hypothetical protein D9758_009649 [Tetrapyrgos nigripes]